MLVRSGAKAAPVLAAGLVDYGVPVALDARIPLARTRLGAGVLAFARAALPGGTAADVLTWLRTPGKLADPDAADALEARVRRTEAVTAADARRLWEGGAGRARRAGATRSRRRGRSSSWTRCSRRRRRSGRRRTRAAPTCSATRTPPTPAPRPSCAPPSRSCARWRPPIPTCSASRATSWRRWPPSASARTPSPAACWWRRRWRSARGASAPCSCAGSRTASSRCARRPSRSSTTTPAPTSPAPRGWCCAATRTSSATSATCSTPACRAPRRCCSSPSAAPTRRATRPSRRRSSTTSARSSPTSCGSSGGTRLLAEVTWPPATAPTPHELRRARAAAERAPEPGALEPPGSDAVRATLAARGPEAARGLETFAACGVRWFVESVLKPQRVEPDPEPMRRGSLAHAVLELTLRRLRERTGSARLTPDTLAAALEELRVALRELRGARGGRRARRRRPACARGGPRALPAPRGRVRRRARAAVPGVELRPRGRRLPGAGPQRLRLLRHGAGGPDRRRR